MCVCVRACVSVCACVYVCMYVYICVFIYIYINIYIYIYVLYIFIGLTPVSCKGQHRVAQLALALGEVFICIHMIHKHARLTRMPNHYSISFSYTRPQNGTGVMFYP